MIVTSCNCGQSLDAPETVINQPVNCPKCNAVIRYICAETLSDGGGSGDFDSHLIITAGPDRIGEQFFIGGVADIVIGKQSDKHIHLPGTRVSRAHCKLSRIDFGPSRWKIIDNRSTNGLFLNNERIDADELQDGDFLQVGEYQLQYVSSYERDVAEQKKNAIASGASVCPSCGKLLTVGAKICIECGVNTGTGRSVVMSKGLDEDDIAIRSDTWARFLSWFIPLGIFPIASEAFGTKKPISTLWILIVTTVVSTFFLFATMSEGDKPTVATLNLMQWSGSRDKTARQINDIKEEIQNKIKELEQNAAAERKVLEGLAAAPSNGRNTNLARRENARRHEVELARKEAQIEALRDELSEFEGEEDPIPKEVRFQWFQPLTAALLHEPQLFMPFLTHLGGNMLFLMVFGMRVNELIGNWRTAVIYPILAVGSGMIDHFANRHTPFHPGLGASGAIMGLAGMYFVFFPVQKVHMIIWFRGYLLTAFQCLYKIFRMRGIWLLVLWIGLNDLLPMLLKSHDQVAHWAHLGGFLCGAAIALLLLITRQVYAQGGDILSTLLGKRAWALVGRPTAWQGKQD